jgi:hypothetical protein
LSPIPEVNGDYIPCRFTPAELENLHAPQRVATLSPADAESLKQRVSGGALAAGESGDVSSALAEKIITNIVNDDFNSLTLSQALGRVILAINNAKEAQQKADEEAKGKPPAEPVQSIAAALRSVAPDLPASLQSALLTDIVKDYQPPKTTDQNIQPAEVVTQYMEALDKALQDKTVAETLGKLDPTPIRTAVEDSLVKASQGAPTPSNVNSVVDSARQFLARLERPVDVGCAMSILSPKETSKAYGYIIAHEYIAVQVVVRNLNPNEEFVLHDVEYAVNTDPTGTPGRFFSGRDKVIVRALSTAQESFDPRNITITTAQGVGALFSAVAVIVGGNMVPASGVVNGAFLPWLQKGWKDQSVDQLNLLNDTGFSSAVNSQTRVPKSGTVMVVTFIPSKQFSQAWWAQPCVSYSYIGSRQGERWTGANKLKFYSPDSDDQEVGRALQVCGYTADKSGPVNLASRKSWWPEMANRLLLLKHGSSPPPYLELPASPELDIDSITLTSSGTTKSAHLTGSYLPALTTSAKLVVRVNLKDTSGSVMPETYMAEVDSGGITISNPSDNVKNCSTKPCGTVTFFDEADVFRRAKGVNYWNWSGQSFQLFANLSLVVVAGTHVVDQSQLDLSISQLKCPA